MQKNIELALENSEFSSARTRCTKGNKPYKGSFAFCTVPFLFRRLWDLSYLFVYHLGHELLPSFELAPLEAWNEIGAEL